MLLERRIAGHRGLTLYVDAPFCILQPKSLESSLLAQAFRLIDKLVTTVISCSRVSFRVFVCKLSILLSVRGQQTYFALRFRERQAQLVR